MVSHEEQVAGVACAVPPVLHVGSGKQFHPDWLNLDVDPRWGPDVVFDLNRPLPRGELAVHTKRFGPVLLGPETFAEIVAQDVLEHIRDLTTAMTTLLGWLRDGGVFKIAVPYDLSLGAWSDPTHLRAFNERSFEYYTNWAWYLGWRTHHFRLLRMDFVTNEYGQKLVAEGKTLAEVARTPRAVDQLYVELVKQPMSEAARAMIARLDERIPGR
ncbi:MAG: hypothetical protein R3F56_19690 [Planctomycetota bacterium]